ncbi:MAG: biotin--[acetyl-CoA-carboxylase] ligase [Deltaproteobacteria bacterium]|jgi:BirA family biotin operon repressor/biotin-[acetyl-CoA-carboxylase] ligase|nr:biotin--[acetyl-CoA-carboxylase] ligase [Deltaproteobacteria bacterium]
MSEATGNIFLLRSGFGKEAETFTPEDEAAVSSFIPPARPWKGPDGADGLRLEVKGGTDTFICSLCPSSFDPAWSLHALGLLPDWGAALALRQSAGRGQLRRSWSSPLGNLHVSFKLPASGLFSSSSATVLLALLLSEAFETLGLHLRLKWPNDLVLLTDRGYAKLGGMLLEEKNGARIAGLGVNCLHMPENALLREEAALPPAVLPKNFAPRAPVTLWLELVKKIKEIYNERFKDTQHSDLLRLAERRLLWRGEEVRIDDPSAPVLTGIPVGLSEEGGLLLRIKNNAGGEDIYELVSGGIARMDSGYRQKRPHAEE